MDFPSQADDGDRAFLQRAAREIDPAQLTEELIGQLMAAHGIEVATAALYLSVRRSSLHGQLIRDVEMNVHADIEEAPTIVVMPGAFHRHHGHTGADGARLWSAAAELEWPRPEMVSVSSLGLIRTNVAALIDHLLQSRAPRLVLASLSKGSADVAAALRHPRADEAFSRVCAWVNLSGLVFGTPLIEWIRRGRIRTMGIHLLLWMKGLRFAALDELCRAVGSPLDAPPLIPPHMRAIHVIGFPLRRHLRHRWAPKGYERLAPCGPNDGGGIVLVDALRLPGLVYPVWGADHYLNPEWDFSASLRSLLLQAAASQTAASAMPASRSTA